MDFVGHDLADSRYKVTSKLGSGSMGFVFKAYDNRLETTVVIKVPMRAGMEDEDFRRRFLQESQLLVKLSHPHVVRVIDVGHQDGLPYVVMQYLSGGTLRDRMLDDQEQPQPMKVETLGSWLREVAKALDFTHSQGIIHRDVKPANILYDEHGNAYLSDFGLTKIMDDAADQAGLKSSAASTAAGYVVGTPNYVAPELVMGHDYDGRVDQYSLAITVYEVLTGKPPLEGPTASATMVNQTSRMPTLLHQVNVDIPEGVSLAVNRALSKSPEKRFKTNLEFAQAVIDGISAPRVNKPTQQPTKATAPAGPAMNQPGVEKSTGVKAKELESAVFTGIISKGVKGKVPCPSCQKRLPLKPGMQGFRARCAHCGSLMEIGQDLATLKLLKEVDVEEFDESDEFDFSTTDTNRAMSTRTSQTQRPSTPKGLPKRRSQMSSANRRPQGTQGVRKSQSGKKRAPKKGEMVLEEEEVFGWKFSKPVAATIGAVLLFVVIAITSVMVFKTSKRNEEIDKTSTIYKDTESRDRN